VFFWLSIGCCFFASFGVFSGDLGALVAPFTYEFAIISHVYSQCRLVDLLQWPVGLVQLSFHLDHISSCATANWPWCCSYRSRHLSYNSGSQTFWPIDHLFFKKVGYSTDHFILLTSHEQLVETVLHIGQWTRACSIFVLKKGPVDH